MVNDRRRFWTTVLFIGLFAPFLAVFSIGMMRRAPAADHQGPPPGAVNPRQVAAAGGGGDRTLSAGGLLSRPTMEGRVDAPLLAAGDGRALWVVRPLLVDGKTPVFQFLQRAPNSGAWTFAVADGNSVWRSHPQAVAVLRPPGATAAAGVPFVLVEQGRVEAFSLTDKSSRDSLPAAHTVRAAAGGVTGIFALTQGVPPTSATRPGDRLTPDVDYSLPAVDPLAAMAGETASAPATASAPTAATAPAPTTVPTSAPATAATSPGESTPPLVNAYWLREGRWTLLPPLGPAGQAQGGGGDAALAPAAAAQVALAVQPGGKSAGDGDRLLALWVDPMRPRDLVVRTLDFASVPAARAASTAGGGPDWSPPIVTHLDRDVPSLARLLTATLDNALFVLWTVPTGASVELHGGQLDTDAASSSAFTLPPGNRLPPLPLGPAAEGISLANDVAAGGVENSIVVVVRTKAGTLSSLQFDRRGQAFGPAAAVEPKAFRRDPQVGQSIAMLFLLLVFSLSLWQWRQRPAMVALPAGLVAAPLYLRAAAFVIDAGVPYALTLLFFGDLAAGLALFPGWISSLAHPEGVTHAAELLTWLGVYLLHVSIGELFFQRSLGKALVGLRVLMVDGKPPTLAAVLLRNVLRVFELGVPFILLYVLISDHRQRLGDLLSRTVVVTQRPPEVPAEEPGDAEK